MEKIILGFMLVAVAANASPTSGWSGTRGLTSGPQTIAGAKSFSGQGAFLGAVQSNIGLYIGTTGLASGGTQQYGLGVDFTGSTAGTTRVVGVRSNVTTVAGSWTTGYRAGFYNEAASRGAGSTITRDIGYGGANPSAGDNNAFIADNITFTGNKFLHSTSTRESVFSGIVDMTAGLRTKVSTANTANPPTNAELISAFGAAATTGAGFTAIVDDNNGHANEYIVWSDGTKYWYATGTAAP